MKIKQYRYYVFCLSANSDTSSMWKYYSKGEGYNLGLNTMKIVSCLSDVVDGEKTHLFYGSVVYDKAQQLKLIEDVFKKYDDMIEKAKLDKPENLSPQEENEWDYNLDEFAQDLIPDLIEDIEAMLPFLNPSIMLTSRNID